MFEQNIVLRIIKLEITKLLDYVSSFSPIVSHYSHFFSPLVVIVVVIFSVLSFAYILIHLYLGWKETKKKCVFFEVEPLKTTEQSSFTTTQLFTGVHGLLKQRSWLYRLFDVQKSYSFEIVSSKELGIRYILRVPAEDAQVLKRSLIAYLPGIQVKETEDYKLSATNTSHVIDLELSNHFAYPIKRQDNLKEYDPIAYITATMTKLNENELVSLQVIASPINSGISGEVNKIRTSFTKNVDILESLRNKGPIVACMTSAIEIILRILILPIGLVVWLSTGGREGPFLPVFKRGPVEATNNTYKDIIEAQIKQKLDQQLFNVTLRLLTSTDSISHKIRIEKGFIAALSPFSNAGHQSLRPKKRFMAKLLDDRALFLFQGRMHCLWSNLVLSAAEVADLYHFPYTSTTKTENISKIHSKELPAPLSLKQKASLDIYFAKNTYGGADTPIGMSLDERRRHVYVLGATGTGKSTMLLSMIKQDIEHNKGLCVIDPHGDLIEQILSVIPKERIPEVVYFNPDDISYPMGINLLELTPGLNSEDALREKEFIAESVISIFHKLYAERNTGPRMEYILRNTIHTAFTVPDATLFTVNKLLVNTGFRKSVVSNLTDENLKDFWKYEFSKAGDYQKVSMVLPITNKIGRFLFSPTAKRILEQGKSTINFDSILNDGKILLCNLSKGKIGEDNSSVFGVLLMAKIQLAALKRARMKQEERKDFYLYVDEFQNFATPAFAQILSEARKYRLDAILAHQTTSQIEEASLVNVTLANTGTVICFRTANPEDERMVLPQFRPYIEPGEIASLPSFHFYMKLGALNPEEPFSGVTTPVHIEYSQNRINEIIEASRFKYAKKYSPDVVKLENKQKLTRVTNMAAVLP